jgi:prepilin-type N-terminal cleavage/methylation domain-containing protein
MKKDNITRHKGFTLIELLVAVAIFSVVAVVLYTCFRSGITSWRRINSEYSIQQKIRYALNIMSKDIKNMAYLSNLAFDGDSDKMGFNTFIQSKDEVFLGRVGYYLFSEETEATKTLARSEETLKQALGADISEEETEEAGIEKGEELLSGISELHFSYLSITETMGETGEREYEWEDIWMAEEGIPLGIKVDLVLNLPEDNRTVTLSKRIYIPTGKSSSSPEIVSE